MSFEPSNSPHWRLDLQQVMRSLGRSGSGMGTCEGRSPSKTRLLFHICVPSVFSW